MVVLACVCQYLEFCDDILVLEDGEVLEAGDHQALMKANGRYTQLITNYQTEQSEVRKNTTKLRCTVALLFSPSIYPYYYYSLSPVLYCFTSTKTVKKMVGCKASDSAFHNFS